MGDIGDPTVIVRKGREGTKHTNMDTEDEENTNRTS